jgi:hypothetical protein
MSEAPLPAWVDAALEGLKKGDDKYAAVKEAVLALARRFTTDGVDPNRKFIETMRAVQEVGDLGAVIAGVIVLLDRKGTEGMSKEDAMAHLDTHVTGLAAATAPSGDGQQNEDMQKAAVDLLGELTRMTGERQGVWDLELASDITRRIAESDLILANNELDEATKKQIRKLVAELNERVAARPATAAPLAEQESEWEASSRFSYDNALDTLKRYVEEAGSVNDTELADALSQANELLASADMPSALGDDLQNSVDSARTRKANQDKNASQVSQGTLQDITKANTRRITGVLLPPPSVLKF